MSTELKSGYIGRALIVDDEPEIVELLKTIIAEEGIEVMGITKSEEVIDAIVSFNPDAIFTDLSMPGMNGLDLLEKVKGIFPNLPVVLVTGQVQKDVLLKAIRMGVYDVIEKPFDIKNIQANALNATISLKLKIGD